jgi:hypothetical protein
VNLDLTRPEHREALRWAAEMYVDDMARVRAWLDNAPPPGECGNRTDAIRALSSPSESAATVRALLAEYKVGLTVSADQYGGEWWLDFVNPYALPHPEQVGEVLAAKVPALILALLACTDAAGALAALREAGR